MDEDAIIQYIANTFEGLDVLRPTDGPGAGDTFVYYDPMRNIDPSKRLPFATIVVKNYGDFDRLSELDRADVFRLNIGASRDTFIKLFGNRSTDRATTHDEYDFAALDRLMPHPVYAAQAWVCVLNPTQETFERVKPLLAEAYARQRADVERRAS
jgi:hypothetical protein